MRLVHLVVRGKVQGVGFRDFVIREAKSRGVDGTVRNRRDGSVDIVLYGLDLAVDYVVERCSEGPPGARVDRLEHLNDQPETPKVGQGVRILPSL